MYPMSSHSLNCCASSQVPRQQELESVDFLASPTQISSSPQICPVYSSQDKRFSFSQHTELNPEQK